AAGSLAHPPSFQPATDKGPEHRRGTRLKFKPYIQMLPKRQAGVPVSDGSMLHNLRHPRRWWRVAAPCCADDAVDDGHADAGQVAELHAVQDGLAGRMLRLVHDDEIGGASDLDQAAVQRTH